MIVLKSFIARENLVKYNAGDDFPCDNVPSYRIAELVAKGYLKGEDEAQLNITPDAEVEKPAEKSATKKTPAKKRAKKG